MSYKFYNGSPVTVRDKTDENAGRDGHVLRQDDSDNLAEVRFEDHRKIYRDDQLNWNTNDTSMDQDKLDELPEVPLRS